MGETAEVLDEGEELTPFLALRREELAAAGRDAVAAPPALVRLLYPASLNQAALFEFVERGVERGEVERQRAVGSFVDQLHELVAMTRCVLEKRQHDEFCGPLLGFTNRPAA